MPSTITLHLPLPPSANRLWRHGNGRTYKSKEYREWLRRADICVLASAILRGHKIIKGKFTAELIIKQSARGDIDNRSKSAIDFLQRIGIVTNDKNLTELNIKRGSAPTGCILTIREAG